MTVPVIETERLLMRGPKMADFDAIAAFWETDRTQFIDGPKDRRAAWQDFCHDAALWSLRGYGMWIAEERASGKVIGWIGFYEPEYYEEVELGWILFEAFEGKGYAAEAARAALSYGFEHFNIDAPCSFISAGNKRSVALAERLGATLEDTRGKENERYFVYRHPALDSDGSPEAYA